MHTTVHAPWTKDHALIFGPKNQRVIVQWPRSKPSGRLVSVKAGLWTMDWTVDWTMDWTVDWTMDWTVDWTINWTIHVIDA